MLQQNFSVDSSGLPLGALRERLRHLMKRLALDDGMHRWVLYGRKRLHRLRADLRHRVRRKLLALARLAR